jgi:PTS system N-acetylglucosamine-specific IIC component
VIAFAFGLGFPVVERGMDALSHAVIESGSIGLFIYGVLNRLLIVTGLHHILNNVAWFIVGDYHGVTGDLKRFMAGDPSAGAFMSGFFPVMMFGLPAACLAMYHAAPPARRRAVGGLLMSMFLTGVTEPIEFTFMFLAPSLFAVHAVLTGMAMVTMQLLGSHLGFGFSAGLFDYVLNYGRATRPAMLLLVGVIYALLYYGLFRYFIVRFDLKTPGREAEPVAESARLSGGDDVAGRFIEALGGAANVREIEACTTRLRLVLGDRARVDARALAQLGSRGTVNIGEDGMQVVVGPTADQVASDIRARLAGSAQRDAPRAIIAALGGAGNVKAVEQGGGRLLVTVGDAAKVDESALRVACARGFARPSPASVHLLHGDAAALRSELASLLG